MPEGYIPCGDCREPAIAQRRSAVILRDGKPRAAFIWLCEDCMNEFDADNDERHGS